MLLTMRLNCIQFILIATALTIGAPHQLAAGPYSYICEITDYALLPALPGLLGASGNIEPFGEDAKEDSVAIDRRTGIVIHPLIGNTNFLAMMPSDSSDFYARNLVNILELIIKTDDEKPPALNLDLEDEIIAGALATHDGQVRFQKK